MEALKDLDVWRRACRLSVDVYRLTRRCREYGFRDQLGRSALSIASNIAEGYERRSEKERLQYISIAKGSCGETWTQLLIGKEAGFLERSAASRAAEEAKQIAGMLGGLIRHLES